MRPILIHGNGIYDDYKKYVFQSNMERVNRFAQMFSDCTDFREILGQQIPNHPSLHPPGLLNSCLNVFSTAGREGKGRRIAPSMSLGPEPGLWLGSQANGSLAILPSLPDPTAVQKTDQMTIPSLVASLTI